MTLMAIGRTHDILLVRHAEPLSRETYRLVVRHKSFTDVEDLRAILSKLKDEAIDPSVKPFHFKDGLIPEDRKLFRTVRVYNNADPSLVLEVNTSGLPSKGSQRKLKLESRIQRVYDLLASFDGVKT